MTIMHVATGDYHKVQYEIAIIFGILIPLGEGSLELCALEVSQVLDFKRLLSSLKPEDLRQKIQNLSQVSTLTANLHL